MHRIWKALRDRRGFTLIEIAIVIAIIGLLLLIALPLFTGARQRAYIAEARQVVSEWKSLAWSCLVEKNFKETKCDSNAETGWTPPSSDSDAWTWTGAVLLCFNTEVNVTVSDTTPTASTCSTDSTAGTYELYVPKATGGATHSYALVLRTSTGKTQESTSGTDIPTP